METNCPNCGAPIKPGTAQCEYCGTWFKEEPKEAETTTDANPNYVPFITPIGPYISSCGQVNIANENALISVYNGQICSTADAIRQAQNQQSVCNTAEWLRRQAEQCQNALPYRPAPRSVCREPERKRKPFENDPEGLAMFVFLLILTIVAFVTGAIVPFIECEETGIIIIAGKAVVCAIFMAIGGLLAFVETQIYKSEVSE